MTGTKIFEIALTMIDEAPINGTFDVNNTAEYKARAPYLLNAIQTELLPLSDYVKVHTISQKLPTPLIGGYDVKEHKDTDVIVESGLAKSYYFEAKGPATVYVEEYNGSWNTLDTITIAGSVDKYTAYSGNITSTGTKTRLRFSGDYYYSFTNYALFKENMYSIPTYRPYVTYTLPADYNTLEEVITDTLTYQRVLDYKFNKTNEIQIPYDFVGDIKITYRPILTEITDLSQSLEIDSSICSGIIPFILGAQIILNENSDIASYLQSRYDELKAKLKKERPAERQKMIDKYDASCNF